MFRTVRSCNHPSGAMFLVISVVTDNGVNDHRFSISGPKNRARVLIEEAVNKEETENLLEACTVYTTSCLKFGIPDDSATSEIEKLLNI